MNEPQNSIYALRSMMFDTLRALSEKEKPMELERAKVINETAQTIINSIKVEYDALRVIGGTGSGFIPALPPKKLAAVSNDTHPAPGHTIHKMEG